MCENVVVQYSPEHEQKTGLIGRQEAERCGVPDQDDATDELLDGNWTEATTEGQKDEDPGQCGDPCDLLHGNLRGRREEQEETGEGRVQDQNRPDDGKVQKLSASGTAYLFELCFGSVQRDAQM